MLVRSKAEQDFVQWFMTPKLVIKGLCIETRKDQEQQLQKKSETRTAPDTVVTVI